MNIVLLRGHLVAASTSRTTVDGVIVWSFDLVTSGDGPKRSVPVVWSGDDRPAIWLAGADLLVAGRVRRRFFRTPNGTQSRTEIVAEHVSTVGPNGPGVRAWRQAWAALGADDLAALRSGTGALPGDST